MGKLKKADTRYILNFIGAIPRLLEEKKAEALFLKAHQTRAGEFQTIWKNATEVLTTLKPVQLMTVDFAFSTIYYDPLYNDIYTAPNLGGFALSTGRHWLGAPR